MSFTLKCLADTANREADPPATATTATTATKPRPTPSARRQSVAEVANVAVATHAQSLRTHHRLPTPEELAAWGEFLLERAAVMEADGELPRSEADRRAWRELLAKFPQAGAYFAGGTGHA